VGADLNASLEICKKAAKKTEAIVGTPIPFGDCLDFICWPGYVVVDTQTMISIVENYCRSLKEQGFGRIIFFVMYGGNVANTLRLAALEYTRQNPSADIVVTTFGQVVDRNTVVQILGKDADVGTSIALAVTPHLVQLDKIKDIEIKGDLQHLRKGYRTRKEYKLSHFFPHGVLRSVGKASSKEIGEKLIEEAANSLVELCNED
jgi:creatinine amidohydrolase/Fe(II)-dependent formamide hydrolase-like protein